MAVTTVVLSERNMDDRDPAACGELMDIGQEADTGTVSAASRDTPATMHLPDDAPGACPPVALPMCCCNLIASASRIHTQSVMPPHTDTHTQTHRHTAHTLFSPITSTCYSPVLSGSIFDGRESASSGTRGLFMSSGDQQGDCSLLFSDSGISFQRIPSLFSRADNSTPTVLQPP